MRCNGIMVENNICFTSRMASKVFINSDHMHKERWMGSLRYLYVQVININTLHWNGLGLQSNS